jgi:hypothetical protein
VAGDIAILVLAVSITTAVLGVRKYCIGTMSEGYGTKLTPFCCFQSCHATSACKLIIDKVFSCLEKGENPRETAAIKRKKSISTTEVKALTFYSVSVQCFWLCILKVVGNEKVGGSRRWHMIDISLGPW